MSLAAAKALDQLGWKPGSDKEETLRLRPFIDALDSWHTPTREDAVAQLINIGAPAVTPLIAKLKDKDHNVRQIAAETLTKIRDPRAVEPLIAALRDDHPNVRAKSALVLGVIGGARAVEPLIAALDDKHWETRFNAAEALGNIGDSRAVEPLIAAVRDEERSVRKAAVTALGKIGDLRAVEPLSIALQDEESSVREAAVEALGNIGDSRAVELVTAALRDDDYFVFGAAKTLEKLGWKPAQDESAAWYWASKKKWDECGRIGEPAIRPLIACLLRRTPTPSERSSIARQLVCLYKSSNLSQESRNEIFAVREWITNIHDDQPHIDESRDCSMNRPHIDADLGVEFPL